MKKTVLLLLCLSALTAQAADGYMSLDSCRWMTNTRLVHEGKTPLTQAYDGQGVIVGVIDGGMQYDHPTFRNAQGELRIRKIWDKNEDGTEVELTDPQASLDEFTLSMFMMDKETYAKQVGTYRYTYRDAYEYSRFHKKTGWGNWINTNTHTPQGNPTGQVLD